VRTPAGALPKIDGELQKLGFVLSVPAVAHYSRGYGGVAMPVSNGVPFFHNHHEAIVAFSFVIVLTATGAPVSHTRASYAGIRKIVWMNWRCAAALPLAT